MADKRLQGFVADRRGVSALEFALIAPVMIAMFVGTVGISMAVMAQRHVGHSTSALGDLVAQSPTLATSDMANVFAAASDVMAPYPTSALQLRVTSVVVDSNGAYRVNWSCSQVGANVTSNSLPALTAGTVLSASTTPALPVNTDSTSSNYNKSLLLSSTLYDSVIMVESSDTYTFSLYGQNPAASSGSTGAMTSTTLPLGSRFYFKPRQSAYVCFPYSSSTSCTTTTSSPKLPSNSTTSAAVTVTPTSGPTISCNYQN